ncbi:unnamed protein product [Lymnaea stagnalis]|uniref:Chitin-binding type-2 domain-containing protein n=1 Tax=Lymnaea stagnalis TaxID=6523 RepID=A0AAV2HS85_LYMST
MTCVASGLFVVLALACSRTWATINHCENVATSEGLRALYGGQTACAPLRDGEPDSGKGVRFLVCESGKVYTKTCENQTRYDVTSGQCKESNISSCHLIDGRSKRGAWRSECNQHNCKLPNCFCFGATPKLQLSDTPMFIMLTFDDFLYNDVYCKFFRPLFVDNIYKLYNPNGCPVKMALYVATRHSNISLIKDMFNAGHEIASHTVSHKLPRGYRWDYPAVKSAIVGVKKNILKATGDHSLVNSIVGFRAPYLRCARDVQFDVLRDSGFLYDSSIGSRERPPTWPWTFDFPPKKCMYCRCPVRRYPGLWEVPLTTWIGDDGRPCSMLDACSVGQNKSSITEKEWFNFFHRHFTDYYYPHRRPLTFFTHDFLFYRNPNAYPALVRWLEHLLHNYPDVWVMPPKWVIEWVKRPLTLAKMKTHRWGC